MSEGSRVRVAVVGGFNMDLVFSAPRRPEPGETLVGTAFGTFIGGKGANQAVAAARAGARVEMIGRLGADSFARDIRAALEHEGVGLRYAVADAQAGTGVAEIVVEPDGTNSIIVVPRANAKLSKADVRRARGAIASAAVLLLQLEVPLEPTAEAARIAREAGVTVILNPAPAGDPSTGSGQAPSTGSGQAPSTGSGWGLPAALVRSVDVLVPNETEARQLTGLPVSTDDEAVRAAGALRERGVPQVLLTRGERGALVADAAGAELVPAFPVRAVDTTAAGDAFCGALAVALAEGRPLRDAARFACAAGALAVTVMGAGPSLPARPAIDQLLGRT